MARTVEDDAGPPAGMATDAEGSWRDRALERSLRAARAKAISRSDRFIATAMELLQETGRTDFTVQELVDRSRTSLRSFYQYFSGKDELLLALLEETIAHSVGAWREEIAEKDALVGLRTVIGRIYGGGQSPDSWEGLNRALSSYHLGLADSHSADYRRALEPLGRLIQDLIGQGVAEGVIRSDIKSERLTSIFIQSVLGAALINTLGGEGSEYSTDSTGMWEFYLAGLLGPGDGQPTRTPLP